MNENINPCECSTFSFKDQRDWIKWDKENNHKTPKTWSELWDNKQNIGLAAGVGVDYIAYGNRESETLAKTSIEKSALALLKIHQLIEVGYGGNVTKEEDLNSKILKYYIGYYFGDSVNNKKAKFNIYTGLTKHSPIRFRTKEEAEEFLSYTENVQLLKDYFQIN